MIRGLFTWRFLIGGPAKFEKNKLKLCENIFFLCRNGVKNPIILYTIPISNSKREIH